MKTLKRKRENLITFNQVKMLKSLDFGYLSGTLNLAPVYRGSCKFAGHCALNCLKFAGRNSMSLAAIARERRTDLYLDHPDIFYRDLMWGLDALLRKAQKLGLQPTMRLNCLSDFPFERDNVLGTGKNIFELYPGIQFIDYTKDYARMFSKLPANYHLTYSINERTPRDQVKRVYSETRFNCAAVYYPEIPEHQIFDGQDFEIVPGDDHDLRHLDPRGKIIGLRFKIPLGGKGPKAGKDNLHKQKFVILT